MKSWCCSVFKELNSYLSVCLIFDVISFDSTSNKREGTISIQMTYIIKTAKKNEKEMLNESMAMFMELIILSEVIHV